MSWHGVLAAARSLMHLGRYQISGLIQEVVGTLEEEQTSELVRIE
jgi:hypothetical protein